MQKAVADFLFGLCFGMGFAIAAAVLAFIGSFLVGADGPRFRRAANEHVITVPASPIYQAGLDRGQRTFLQRA